MNIEQLNDKIDKLIGTKFDDYIIVSLSLEHYIYDAYRLHVELLNDINKTYYKDLLTIDITEINDNFGVYLLAINNNIIKYGFTAKRIIDINSKNKYVYLTAVPASFEGKFKMNDEYLRLLWQLKILKIN